MSWRIVRGFTSNGGSSNQIKKHWLSFLSSHGPHFGSVPSAKHASVAHNHALRMHVQCTNFGAIIGGHDNCLLSIDFSIEIIGYYW